MAGRDDVRGNEYNSERIQRGLHGEKQALLKMVKRCEAAFDVEFYLQNNKDLAVRDAARACLHRMVVMCVSGALVAPLLVDGFLETSCTCVLFRTSRSTLGSTSTRTASWSDASTASFPSKI
jgi:hypothetical protein